MATNSVLAKMAVVIGGETAEFNKALKDTSSGLGKFQLDIAKIAGAVGVAFGIKEVAAFGLEVSKLGGEATGVENAFKKLPNSTKLLDELKDATHDTVSELELMKRSVQASNFNISLQALPKLLEFATLRAQQTGQSVNYLVDSIVTGIGRKSPLILDNLGISATQLKSKLNGVSLEAAGVGEVARVVGEIASESLGNMASFSENAATELQKLSASFENAEVAIGKASNQTGLLNGALVFMRDILDGISGNNKVAMLSGDLANFIKADIPSRIQGTVDKLKQLRRETGTPLKFDVDSLIKSFDLSSTQAIQLKKSIQDINNALSNEERRLKIFSDFAKGYGDVETAADAFITAQIRAIDATSAQIDSFKELKEVSKDNTFDETIAQLEAEVAARYKLIEVANAQAKSLKVVTVDQVQTITTLEATLKSYQDQVSSTDINDIAAIGTLNKKSQALKEQIDYLKALVPLSRAALSNDPIVSKTTDQANQFPTIAPVNTNAKDKIVRDLIDINQAFEKSKTFGKDWADATGIAFDQLAQRTISLNSSIAQGLSSFADALGQAAAGVGNFGTSILSAIAGFMRSFGEQLIALGIAAAAADVLVENPYTAVAAGIALVALAGAATASVAKTQRGITGRGGSGGSSITNATAFDSRSNTNINLSGELTVQNGSLGIALSNENIRTRRLG